MIPLLTILLLNYACNAQLPSSNAIKAFTRELRRYQRAPLEDVMFMTDEKNFACWYFVMAGAKFIDPTVENPVKSPYSGGEYFGLIEFGPNYPNSAFKIYMYTPNGRFAPGESICMQIGDDYSKSCTWGPQGIVEALRSFMVTEEIGRAQLKYNFNQRVAYAMASKEFNLKSKWYPHVFGQQTIESANMEANLAYERSLLKEEEQWQTYGIEQITDVVPSENWETNPQDLFNQKEIPIENSKDNTMTKSAQTDIAEDFLPKTSVRIKKSFLRKCIERLNCKASHKVML